MDKKDEQIMKLNADLAWCVDVLERIDTILKADHIQLQEQVDGIIWLVKQGLKVKRED